MAYQKILSDMQMLGKHNGDLEILDISKVCDAMHTFAKQTLIEFMAMGCQNTRERTWLKWYEETFQKIEKEGEE